MVSVTGRSVRLGRAMSDQLKILYQSKDVLVVDKNVDTKINSNDECANEVTVAKQLASNFPHLLDNTIEFGFRFAHRLDHATSGVLCIALNKTTAGTFQNCFSKRKILKHYLALVHGHMEDRCLFIDVPIGRSSIHTDIYRMCVSSSPHCVQPVKRSTTVAVCLETGLYAGTAASKLLLIPLTGRTHQLRVHCCHIGHRIIGDYMYSDRTDTQPPRMMLHSYRIHVPLKPQPLDVTAPDYFVSGIDPSWQATQVYTTYEAFCDTFYNQGPNKYALNFTDLNPKTVTVELETS
ncbi:RNA pseudouridylate synthase domain-containing protein 1-like [Haliotis rubra]|uniref:RNA pseudouridylate synthase domain-containing protein 1-like n=1 Tax=Haliotis rubra TaxID=36100 RepID=UPI001EE530F8|nr:RNA pseudouridylate synthase domain-containing protein 1-like [Haliotis rubra]